MAKRYHTVAHMRYTWQLCGPTRDIHGNIKIYMALFEIYTANWRYTWHFYFFVGEITLFLGPLTFQNHWGFSRKSTETYAIWGYYRFSHEIMGLLALFSLYSRAFFVEKLLHFGNGVLFS